MVARRNKQELASASPPGRVLLWPASHEETVCSDQPRSSEHSVLLIFEKQKSCGCVISTLFAALRVNSGGNLLHRGESPCATACKISQSLALLRNDMAFGSFIIQKGRASFKTRGLMRGRRPASVITSTLQFNNASSSRRSRARSRRLRPVSRFTRKSISLSGPASPLATEPKTRTSCAPFRAAICRISRRLE